MKQFRLISNIFLIGILTEHLLKVEFEILPLIVLGTISLMVIIDIATWKKQ